MSRSTRCFTICLSNTEAESVQQLLGYFGGTVGGFATSVIRDYIELSPTEIVQFRQLIRAKAEQRRQRDVSVPKPAGEGDGT